MLMVVGTVLLCLNSIARAASPVVFSKQVLPMLRTQCWGCHSGANPASGYSMENRAKLLAGARHGPAIVPGKGDESPLILYMTGKLKPQMPPGGAVDMDRISLLRRWINEGANVDTMAMPLPAPSKTGSSAQPGGLAGARKTPAPVTSLAFSPDGKLLAVGGYRVVRLLDPATGSVVRSVSGAIDQVQALAWSTDGKLLAVGGGTPGESGEVILFETQTWKPIRKLTEHTEVVYAIAWKPNAMEIATGSLDKTARIWDANTGKCVHIIKDHADSVFGVAYSPDGKLLATGSADRSAKIFDTATWKRVAILSAHQDAVTHVAFNKDGTLLATAGADNNVRIWQVKIGAMDNPVRNQGEGDMITDCAFSPDGSLFVWGAANHSIKVFNSDVSQEKASLQGAQDWVYSVAIGNDNQTVVAGTHDGCVLFWDVKSKKMLRTVTLLPGGPKIVTAGLSDK